MQQVYQAIQQISDPDDKFRGITYQLTNGNQFNIHWLLQTPNGWGKPIDQIPYFLPGCPDCNPDFGLPLCNADNNCINESSTGLMDTANI